MPLPTYKNIKLLTSHNKELLFIIISRPNAKNAIDTDTAFELSSAVKHYNESAQYKIAILSGEGDTFCAGADLKEVSQISSNILTNEKFRKRLNEYGTGPLGPTRMTSTKPVIAAVKGFAVAGGLELALWCDLVVSHKEAIFGVFCRRFSVPLIDGGTVRLARVIGYSRAMDMILTGRAIKGEEAFQWGLVNRLVEKPDEVMAEAEKLASFLCDLPQDCMLSDRMSLIESVYGNLERDLRNEMRLGMRTMMSGATVSGAKRFSEGNEGKHGNVVKESLKKNVLRLSKL